MCETRGDKMKRCLMKSTHFVVVFLAVPVLLSAQEFRNTELNFFVAGSAFTKNKYTIGPPQISPPASGVFKIDDRGRGGIRINVNTTRHWGEEFFFSYEQTKAHLTTGTSTAQDVQYDVRIYDFGVNVMYYLYREETRDSTPYFTAGLGGNIFQGRGSSTFGTSTNVAGNYGIGFKRSLSRRFGFRMDLRGFIVRQPDFGLPRSSANPNVAVFPATGVIHDLEPSAGLYIKFRK